MDQIKTLHVTLKTKAICAYLRCLHSHTHACTHIHEHTYACAYRHTDAHACTTLPPEPCNPKRPLLPVFFIHGVAATATVPHQLSVHTCILGELPLTSRRRFVDGCPLCSGQSNFFGIPSSSIVLTRRAWRHGVAECMALMPCVGRAPATYS